MSVLDATERDLYEKVLASPRDPGPRMVLADRLLARGERLGEWFVLSAAEDLSPAQQQRLDTLRDSEPGKLLGPLDDMLYEDDREYEHGLLVGARMRPLPGRVDVARDHWMWASLRRLDMTHPDLTTQQIELIATCRTLTRLERLSLGYRSGPPVAKRGLLPVRHLELTGRIGFHGQAIFHDAYQPLDSPITFPRLKRVDIRSFSPLPLVDRPILDRPLERITIHDRPQGALDWLRVLQGNGARQLVFVHRDAEVVLDQPSGSWHSIGEEGRNLDRLVRRLGCTLDG